jgi:hypothetical protein
MSSRDLACLSTCQGTIYSDRLPFNRSHLSPSNSLGIPTYKYGHEPSNRFATFQAKFFSNALREADLLDICSGGLIYTQGSAGSQMKRHSPSCDTYP